MTVRNAHCRQCGGQFSFYFVVPYCTNCLKQMTLQMEGKVDDVEYVKFDPVGGR